MLKFEILILLNYQTLDIEPLIFLLIDPTIYRLAILGIQKSSDLSISIHGKARSEPAVSILEKKSEWPPLVFTPETCASIHASLEKYHHSLQDFCLVFYLSLPYQGIFENYPSKGMSGRDNSAVSLQALP